MYLGRREKPLQVDWSIGALLSLLIKLQQNIINQQALVAVYGIKI